MITNKDIKICSEQIFSYTSAYQVPFYGRERVISELMEKITNVSPAEAIIISQPLGIGKTFLVYHMINSKMLDISLKHPFLYVREIAENPSVMEQFPSDILVIDEIDIKTPYKKMIKGIELIGEFLDKSNKNAILIGDYSLRNEMITACLEHKNLISLFEGIDEDFFKGVLDMRFRHFLEDKYDFELESIMEPELIRYLVPDWMKNVNNFRSIFSVLQGIVSEMKYNSERVYLTVEQLQDFFHKDREYLFDDYQKRYYIELKQYIKTAYPNGNNIGEGFSEIKLYELANAGGMNMSIHTFREDILEPFSAMGLLISCGIPRYENSKFVRRPGPYLPSLRLII